MAIEDHALIGDTQTAALVTRDGSIDWLCLPRFDSPACFAALLGDESHGHWRIRPARGARPAGRRYRADTLVLETDLEGEGGVVSIVDCMPIRDRNPTVTRLVKGTRGSVDMEMELVMRFDYGRTVPWVRRRGGSLEAIAGGNALSLHAPVETYGRDLTTRADFTVHAGETVAFELVWNASHEKAPGPVEPRGAVDETERWWKAWAQQCDLEEHRDLATRSLITLKALTYSPTGGMVASATTSLPEKLGGIRNWDYRYCWIRDATFTMYSFLATGYLREAQAWRDWLLRAVAGDPAHIPVVYGIAGERLIWEEELPWLPGYAAARPVRVGNDAAGQVQLDVFGEVADAAYLARTSGIECDEHEWDLQLALLEHLESSWQEPDDGIWEVRGAPHQFTHSKIMAWVAFDRAIKTVEQLGMNGPVDRWRAARDRIHREVCDKAWDGERRTFTQYYGSRQLDASLLRMPLVGFLPVGDERVRSTIEAIRHELGRDGFLARYPSASELDGLPDGEGAFLPCSFWLVDVLALGGRVDEAHELFDRVAATANDVGLLSEEYDPDTGTMLGNFPQALTHVSLVNSVLNLTDADAGPAHHRSRRSA